MTQDLQKLYQQKRVSAEAAAALVQSGQTVFLGEFCPERGSL